MILTFDRSNRLTWRERLGAILVVGGLLVPFIPIPGDGTANMKLVSRSDTAPKPVKVVAPAPRSVCEVLAFSLAYENRETGAYTRVACKQPH